ncbi:MAG: serine hydrolase [Chitinophagaceae bacterium]
MKKTILFIAFFVVIFYSNAQPIFIKDSIKNYIEKGLKDWNIPGLAIAIVKDGKIEMMQGFGVADISTQKPVTEKTLFMVASNSKLFTGTALAQLEYNKKLSLNDKIVQYFPDFKLYDKNATEMVTIKDMLGHKIGTKTFQGDFSFWDANISRAEVMYKMRFLKPIGVFRQDYGYCNSCFLSAGEVIPKVTGKPWEVYVYDSIIQPLGMNSTAVLSRNMEKMNQPATPYTTSFTNAIASLPYDNIDNIAPAASIVSNVQDMSKWLIMQLDSGKYNGRKIIEWPVIRKTRDVITLLGSRKNGASNFMGYGLGVFVKDYYGKQVYWHTGGAFGFVSNTCFIPEERLGICILTNQDNQNFFEALRLQIIDAYLNQPFVHKSEQMLPSHNASLKKSQEEIDGWRSRIKGQKPVLDIASYVGTYHHELYGKIEITQINTGLKIVFKSHDNLSATLHYMDNHEWLLTYDNIVYGIFPTKFTLQNNKVMAVEIKACDFVEYDSYIFNKQ